MSKWNTIRFRGVVISYDRDPVPTDVKGVRTLSPTLWSRAKVRRGTLVPNNTNEVHSTPT